MEASASRSASKNAGTLHKALVFLAWRRCLNKPHEEL